MRRPFRFAPPPAAPAALLRPRLLESLAARFGVRLVTVEAAAGLGKTTLLAQAVGENRLRARGRDVWLTCEPADASASALLGGLLEALGVPPLDDRPTVERVCEAVWASAPEQVCLVLDDAHHVAVGSPGEEVFQRLVDELPENGHLLVAARRLPTLATARLLAQDRCVEVDEEGLRLDEDESAALAAHHGVAADVVRVAGGWAALAELTARTGVAHAERFVWEEVIGPLPPAERDAFLLVVAVGGVGGDAIDAVVGRPVDVEPLRRLPMVAGDRGGGVWPHPLWEDLLRSRIDAVDAAAARRRLADVLLTRGANGGAFELLAGTGDWDHALAALFEACNDQRQPPWPDQLERWAALLPDDVAATPEAAYLRAMVARVRDPWSPEASSAFADAVDGFARRGDPVRECTAAVRAAHVAWLRCDADMIEELHERGRKLLAAGLPIEPILAVNRAVAADLAGDGEELRARAAEIGDVEPRLRHFRPLFRVFAGLGDGDADAVVADADEAAALAAPVTPAAGTGWAATAPVAVAWARGDLLGVLAMEPADPGPRHSFAERVPMLALACVAAAHVGDDPTAARHLDGLSEVLPSLGDRDFVAGYAAVAAATVAAARGDEAGAVAALASGLDGRSLEPAAAGRAVLSLPAVPYLFHPESRALLDSMDSGPSRQRVLDTCRALLDAREGTAARGEPPGSVLDAEALLTALPAPLAVELVVRLSAGGRHRDRLDATVARLAELAPASTREALRAFAASGDAALARAARGLLAAVPIPPPHHVRIEVLGPARLLRDGEPVDDPHWRRQRVRQLVCALVAFREVRRARLGALLWPEFDEDAVSANLRMTLSYVQALLEPHRAKGDAPWFLQQASGVLRLGGEDHVSVDAWEVEASLDAADEAAAAGAASAELSHLMAALDRWRGEPLDDVAGEEWAEPVRTQLQERLVRAAVRAGDLLVATGRHADAVRVAEAALGADPWCEPAIRLRVAAHVAAGDRSAARTAYDAGLKALADLGVPPEPATAELGRRLLT